MIDLLKVNDLDVQFPTRHGTTYAVKDVSLTLKPGEVLGDDGRQVIAEASSVGKTEVVWVSSRGLRL